MDFVVKITSADMFLIFFYVTRTSGPRDIKKYQSSKFYNKLFVE